MNEPLELTVLMPCLNEARSLAFCIEEAKECIAKHGISAEILIADNGSTDGSPQIGKQCGARVISVAEKGYGAALRGGILAAKGKYIIIGDCDGSYDFSHIPHFLNKLHLGFALVVGNRFSGGIEKGAMPVSHKIGVPFLSALAQLKYRVPIGDFHCGLRGFERETALSLGLCHSGMEFATEIIARFAKCGAPVCEIPTVLRRDKRGTKSHLRTVRDGCRHLKFILLEK